VEKSWREGCNKDIRRKTRQKEKGTSRSEVPPQTQPTSNDNSKGIPIRAAPIPPDFAEDIAEYNRLIRNYVEGLRLRCNPLYINKLAGFKWENELIIQERYGRLLQVFDLLQAQTKQLMVIQRDSLAKIVGEEEIENAIEDGMIKIAKVEGAKVKRLPEGLILTRKVLEAMYGKPR